MPEPPGSVEAVQESACAPVLFGFGAAIGVPGTVGAPKSRLTRWARTWKGVLVLKR